MATEKWPFRVTPPMLDVIEVLIEARDGVGKHGWQIMKETKRTGPTVYQQLERLTKAGWVERRWEELDDESGKPRRRYYWIKGVVVRQARALLAERRPQAVTANPEIRPGLALRNWVCGLVVGGGR